MRFPLAHAGSVAVATDGRIFVASQFFERVQVYDQRGVFLRGLFCEGGGPVQIGLDEDQRPLVFVRRLSEIQAYNHDGQLLGRSPSTGRFGTWDDRGRFRDKSGREFHIRHPIICPRVEAVDPTGTKITVIENPLWLRPFVGPLCPWLGVPVLVLADRTLACVRRPRRAR